MGMSHKSDISHGGIDPITGNVDVLHANDDCCKKCAKDEACKIDKNGCECWKPASVGNTLSYKSDISHGGIDPITGNVDVLHANEDCCKKCAKDEACKIDKNG